MDDFRIESLIRIAERARRGLEKSYLAMTQVVDNNFMAQSSTLRNLVFDQERVALLTYSLGPIDKLHEVDAAVLLERAEKFVKLSTKDMLRTMRSLSTSNEVNSTCAMTRAMAAVKLEAKAELVQDIAEALRG